MRRGLALVHTLRVILCAGAVLAASSGCAMLNSFLDPTTVGQFPMKYQERGIRRTLTVFDQGPTAANTVEPKPDDLVPSFSDYRMVPGDQIEVTIDDLLSVGLQYSRAQQISNTGFIRLPVLGSVRVEDMTEDEIEQDIERRLREQRILADPIVQVVGLTRRADIFYILGSVTRAGPYPLSKPNMRLLEAIGMAGDIGPEVRKLYVIRASDDLEPTPADLPEVEPTTDETAPPPDLIIPPPDEDEWGVAQPGQLLLASSQEPTTAPGSDTAAREDLEDVIAPEGARREDTTSPDRPFEPIIIDPDTNEPVQVTPPEPTDEPPAPDTAAPDTATPEEMLPPDEFDWEDVPGEELEQRRIEIDARALKAGDPRYNVIVRPQDVINVPVDTGVYYMMGEVARPGVFAFSGREITVKQAIAISGGFTPLAWPSRCEIIRRQPGSDRQVTISVNLDRIFAGLEDDVFLKDEDILNVGTSPVAPFLFVIRNSFRFTYGFGFVYDRNFADVDSYSAQANPNDIERAERRARGLPF